MAKQSKTGISWTDETWNPLRGCSRVSEGCRNCYAESTANRFKGQGQPYEGLIARGRWNGVVRLAPNKLAEPWGWVKPRKVFVNSMSDLFHESVPFEYIAAVFWIMAHTTRHTYQVLTKRPERMYEFFKWLFGATGWSERASTTHMHDPDSVFFADDKLHDAAHTFSEINDLGWEAATATRGGYDNCGPAFPYSNVWLGVSIEDQKTANERIPWLLKVPAAVRWLSVEPLLGSIDFEAIFHRWDIPADSVFSGIDWVVVGGESGADARPMHIDWVRDVRDQVLSVREDRDVKFHFKQWGEYAPNWFCNDAGEYDGGAIWMDRVGKKNAGRLLDGVLWDEFPSKGVDCE